VSNLTDTDVRILAIREIARRIEAIIEWLPDPVLRLQAEGAQLNLASHVVDRSDGRMIVFDGPRALTCDDSKSNLAVLPLPIPLEPGEYDVEIEPVVELRFWASTRGYLTFMLEAERKADGSLRLYCPRTERSYAIDGGSLRKFSIDTPLYGLGDSERCVEIPWVLSRYSGEKRVLDVGYSNAEPRYVDSRNALNMPLVVGIDLAAKPQAGIFGISADALLPPFCRSAFDLILAISVIEHIGRDNSLYYSGEPTIQESGDLNAAAALSVLLNPGGRLLITVPFGRLEDHGWFIQYNHQRVEALIKATGCRLTLAEYYVYDGTGWDGPVDPKTLANVPYCTFRSSAGAVACLEFTRPSII
jgi:hypothetical protein